MKRKGKCAWCGNELNVDTKDNYVQCPFCSNISEIEKRVL